MNQNSHKISNKKVSKHCSKHFNIKLCATQIHNDLPLVYGLLLIYQDVIIGYVNLRAKIKFNEMQILWECIDNTNVPAVLDMRILVVGLGTEISD